MFILGNLLLAVAEVLQLVFGIYEWVLIIRVIISWVNADSYNPIVQFIYNITEPVLQPIRKMLPSLAIDFSPLIVFLLLKFIRQFLISSLIDLAQRLG